MTMWNDPLERDLTMRPWIEEEYTRWRAGLASKSGYPVDFDTAWAKLGMKAKLAFYEAAARKKQADEAQMAAAEAGIGTGQKMHKVKVKERVRQSDGSWKEVESEEWQPSGPSASPAELKSEAAKARMAQTVAEAQLKDIEFWEEHRPEREAITESNIKTEQYVAEQQLKSLKREQARKTFEEPVKKMLIQPVQEAVVGGFKALKATGYGKGSMEMAREAFVPQPGVSRGGRESPLRPAPRARFTTPMVTAIPPRMPVTKYSSGKKIPAGEAILAKAEFARKAVVAPTVAGSLLTTSVGKMPAAQALVPQRPTRLGLSNLRVGVDTSGIRRGGALPRLRIKRKNLYNDQLKRIRGLLR